MLAQDADERSILHVEAVAALEFPTVQLVHPVQDPLGICVFPVKIPLYTSFPFFLGVNIGGAGSYIYDTPPPTPFKQSGNSLSDSPPTAPWSSAHMAKPQSKGTAGKQ